MPVPPSPKKVGPPLLELLLLDALPEELLELLPLELLLLLEALPPELLPLELTPPELTPLELTGPELLLPVLLPLELPLEPLPLPPASLLASVPGGCIDEPPLQAALMQGTTRKLATRNTERKRMVLE
jgi:hypothetical protein